MTSGDVMPHKFRLPTTEHKVFGKVYGLTSSGPYHRKSDELLLAQRNEKRFMVEPALDPAIGNPLPASI